MAREAGARKVYFSSCAPPITHPHIYGIDLASPEELIASSRDQAEIAKIIAADKVIYQDLEDLKDACRECSPPNGPKDFEVGVFCGKYVTSVPEGYFEHLSALRGNNIQRKPVSNSLVASSGPVIVSEGEEGAISGRMAALPAGPRSPLREDISLHNWANEPERRS
jgi:amidophosphoribosyltransferase